jgi:HEPN domain-containing protein
MPEKDPSHWLYRLTPTEWLQAAENELAAARRAAAARQQRAAVTQARRAAGMALNALLLAEQVPDPAYGRSYMDHLHALAGDPRVREEVRLAARRLLDMPLTGQVVAIRLPGRGDEGAHIVEPAVLIMSYVREVIAPPAQA